MQPILKPSIDITSDELTLKNLVVVAQFVLNAHEQLLSYLMGTVYATLHAPQEATEFSYL